MTEEDFQNVANRLAIEGFAEGFVEDSKASVYFFSYNVPSESDTGEELADGVIDNYYS